MSQAKYAGEIRFIQVCAKRKIRQYDNKPTDIYHPNYEIVRVNLPQHVIEHLIKISPYAYRQAQVPFNAIYLEMPK